MRLLALVQLLVLHHYRACCGGQDAPLVSILTLANGQTWCNRNALLNACYQSYPRHALELLLLEESLAPSSAFLHRAPRRLDPVAARGNSSHREGNYHWDTVLAPRLASEGALCGFPFRYFWFNASDQLDEVLRSDPNLRRRHSPNLGAKRNFLSFKASGDILANFDNDDFYHPNYLRRVVRKGFRADGGDGSGGTAPVALVSVEPEAEAVVNPDGTVAIAAPRADEVARRAAPGRECDGAGHKVAWSRAAVAACEWTPRNMNEEEGFWECARARGLRERVVTMDDAAADASDDGNALLMVKFVSGVSVSQAGFLVNIRDRAFLRRRDLRAQLQMQHAYYEQLHELARPAHVAKLAFAAGADADGVVVTAREVGARAGGASIVDAIETTRRWRQFQLANRDFYGERSARDAECPGFALLVGEVFQCCAGDKKHDADGRALHADVGDARNLEACCAACRDAPTCSSFAFADERGDCTHFYTAAPPNDLLRFKLPSATFVVASFTRNEFIDATIGGFKVAER